MFHVDKKSPHRAVAEVIRKQQTKPGICYGYARVSTYEQVTSQLGIDSQVHACQQLFESHYAHQGWTWAGMWIDKAVSGSTQFYQRPAGRQLNEHVRRGDAVIALRADRVFRSFKDCVCTSEDFLERGLRIHFQEGGLCLIDEPTSQLVFRILSSVAEFERQLTANRTKEALWERALRGYIIGHAPPFGFTFCGKRKIQPDDSERRIMGHALRWHEQGATYPQIHALLLDRGAVRTYRPLIFKDHQIGRLVSDEIALREIQKSILSGEVQLEAVPLHYRTMHLLPACRDLFPFLHGEHN